MAWLASALLARTTFTSKRDKLSLATPRRLLTAVAMLMASGRVAVGDASSFCSWTSGSVPFGGCLRLCPSKAPRAILLHRVEPLSTNSSTAAVAAAGAAPRRQQQRHLLFQRIKPIAFGMHNFLFHSFSTLGEMLPSGEKHISQRFPQSSRKAGEQPRTLCMYVQRRAPPTVPPSHTFQNSKKHINNITRGGD